MEEKIIGGYKLENGGVPLVETRYAKLYRAVKCSEKGGQDELWYAVKEYCDSDLGRSALEKEKRITQHIENASSKSILVPILETGEYEGRQYAVMQYKANGIFLQEIICRLEEKYGEGNIPFRICIKIAEEILKTLQVLHHMNEAEGYLHLDIHPGNIFFESADLENEKFGKAKFIDFFSAVPIAELKTNGLKADLICTYSMFSAPEQMEGETSKFCEATDLYSVAAILERMLYGKEGERKSGIMDAALGTFFNCALNYNPVYRYATAQKMRNRLKQLRRLDKEISAMHYFEIFSLSYEALIHDMGSRVKELEFSEQEFCTAVGKLERELLSDKIQVDKCDYIFSSLWALSDPVWDELKPEVKNSLICSGIACGNYTGNWERMVGLFEKLQGTKNAMPVMEYLSLVNRVAVTYADIYRFREAYDIILKNTESLERIKKCYCEVALLNGINGNAEQSVRMKELGRAYSAKAVYAAMLGRPDAMISFEKALDEFGEDYGNRRITVSHILNYSFETNDRDLYRQYFNEYFGPLETEEQVLDKVLEGLEKKEQEDLDFYSLYTLMKGIYSFCENPSDSLIKKVKTILYERQLAQRKTHPAQLVYKYIGLILYKAYGKLTVEAEEAFFHSVTCIPSGNINSEGDMNILKVITYQTTAIFNTLSGHKEENKKLKCCLEEQAESSGWNELKSALEDGREITQLLKLYYC